MGVFSGIVRRIVDVGTSIGSGFLVGIMVLIVAGIIVRLCGRVIAGSYELVELLVILPVAFTLAYTALRQGHVAASSLVSRFPPRLQAIVASITWLLSLCTSGLIVWANTDIMLEMWLREQSELLRVPYLPFRFVWVFGLLLLCLVFLIDLFKALKQAVSR